MKEKLDTILLVVVIALSSFVLLRIFSGTGLS